MISNHVRDETAQLTVLTDVSEASLPDSFETREGVAVTGRHRLCAGWRDRAHGAPQAPEGRLLI